MAPERPVTIADDARIIGDRPVFPHSYALVCLLRRLRPRPRLDS